MVGVGGGGGGGCVCVWIHAQGLLNNGFLTVYCLKTPKFVVTTKCSYCMEILWLQLSIYCIETQKL